MDIERVAYELAEELEAKKERYQANRVDRRDFVERIIRTRLREEMASPPVEYAVHRVVDGRVCPDACATATVRKEKR